MTTAFFDTNAFFNVFEDRQPGLYATLQRYAREAGIVPVASDALLREIVEGIETPNFDIGITRLFALNPRWIFAAALPRRDLILHYDPLVQTDAAGALLTWHEVLPIFFEPPEVLLQFPDLRIPTPEALKQVFRPALLKQHTHRYDDYLKMQHDGLYKRLETESKESLFAWLVTRSLNNDPRGGAFAAELYKNPDRAPAFRLSFELECYLARPVAGRHLKNKFLDRLHATLMPFVDLFITNDVDLIKALEWYDREVRTPAGKAPYMAKVCRGWQEFEERAQPLRPPFFAVSDSALR